jgi:tetratricopeptide (TPR) repeat protein
LKRNDDALLSCERVLALDAANHGAWFNKGLALLRMGRMEESNAAFSEAYRLGDRGASQGLSETLFALGKFEEALFHCEKALELEPDNPSLWLRKGRTLRELKRPAEAIPCYDRLIELEPKNYLAWYNKGVSLADLKKYQEALDCNERALELEPNFAWAWCNKAASLASLGKYRKALPYFEKAVSLGDTESKKGVEYCLSHMAYIFRFFHWLEKLGSPK